MADPIPVVQVGLGALGRLLTGYLIARPYLHIVGAVDTDPGLVGRDLGEVAGIGKKLGVQVCDDLPAGLANGSAAVAVQTTVSDLSAAKPQIEALVSRGANVVSSCEELSYPWQTAPAASADLDRRARAAGVSVLGTGVNPGFLMDLLPIVLTAICSEVRTVTVLRYQDARSRRLPFQKKIGAGLTLEEFAAKKARGTLRHVGLTESMHMIASRLGWPLDRTEDIIEPVVAQRSIASDHLTVEAGHASGVYQRGLGYVGEEERIRLEFRASLGEEDVQDTVIVDGVPPLTFTNRAGVNGDVATCSLLVNAVPAILSAPPGLRTMADIPPVSWLSG